MKFSNKDFFSKFDQVRSEEILNGKLHFLSSAKGWSYEVLKFWGKTTWGNYEKQAVKKNGGGGEGVGYQIDDTKYAKEGGVL